MRHTVSDGSGRYDPLDIASLQLWQQGQQEDNRQQIRRLLVNLPLAVEEELTPRQRQLLRMHFTQGKRVTDIAQELGISKSTVSRTLAGVPSGCTARCGIACNRKPSGAAQRNGLPHSGRPCSYILLYPVINSPCGGPPAASGAGRRCSSRNPRRREPPPYPV